MIAGTKTGESVSSDDVFEAWVPFLTKPNEAWDFARRLPSEAEVLQHLSQGKTPKGKEIDEVFGSQTFNWTRTLRSIDGRQAPHRKVIPRLGRDCRCSRHALTIRRGEE